MIMEKPEMIRQHRMWIESAIVANSDVLRSAQYQESTKYELKVNGTPVSVYKYQKQTDPGSQLSYGYCKIFFR